MSELQPVQPVGFNTDFIRNHPLTLFVEPGYAGRPDTVLFEDGTPLIIIERDLLSARHRMNFISAQSDQILFEMQKERFRSEYYAEHPNGGDQNLFDIDIDTPVMGGPTAIITFPNVANGGIMTQFEYKVHTFDKVSTVVWEGQPVAEVERQSLTKNCTVWIAPRVDPLPILVMLMALTDRARTRRNGSSSIGGTGGFHTSSTGAGGISFGAGGI